MPCLVKSLTDCLNKRKTFDQLCHKRKTHYYSQCKTMIDYVLDNAENSLYVTGYNEKGEFLKVLSLRASASMIIVGPRLSQRRYNKAKTIFLNQGVEMSSWEECVDYLKNLMIPNVTKGTCRRERCICASVSVKSVLNSMLCHPELRSQIDFYPMEKQSILFERLALEEPDIFKIGENLKPSEKSIFIRHSSDGFRALRGKAERTSISILNNKKNIFSPFFEIPINLYEGEETYEQLRTHLGWGGDSEFGNTADGHGMYKELSDLALGGFTSDENEYFNVIVLTVPDMKMLEVMLGRCSSLSHTGDCWCQKTLHERQLFDATPGPLRSIKEMFDNGMLNKVTKKKPVGQERVPMFWAMCIYTMPPDSLHLILGVHKQLMKSFIHTMSSIGTNANILDIPEGFRIAGLHAVAKQFKNFYLNLSVTASKVMSVSIKKAEIALIGNDTRILESRIEMVFDYVFRFKDDDVRYNVAMQDNRNKTKYVIMSYKCFSWIGNYLRRHTMTLALVDRLQSHIVDFFDYLFVAIEKTLVHNMFTLIYII